MKRTTVYILFFSALLTSCQNNNDERVLEQQREIQKKETIFSKINQGWVFAIAPVEPTTQAKINGWMEWRNFVAEMNQKPKSTLGAFQKKAALLSKKVIELNNNIPKEFDKPQIKSRITAVTTKIKTLDLFIHLREIPSQKVIQIIGDTNLEIGALQRQMEEIVLRALIPREAGEPDFVKMKDTVRALPNSFDSNKLQVN